MRTNIPVGSTFCGISSSALLVTSFPSTSRQKKKLPPNLHLSLLILHDAVRAALEVLIASRDLTQEQQDELHLWLSKYIDLL